MLSRLVKNIAFLILSLLIITACDEELFLASADGISVNLRLEYPSQNQSGSQGLIRYVVRAYPVSNGKVSTQCVAAAASSKSVSEGYDQDVTIGLAPGDYKLMVWSDFVESVESTPFHSVEDFSKITLQGIHSGNNPLREAFRGSCSVTVSEDSEAGSPLEYNVMMENLLAKFEIVAEDLPDFRRTNPSVDVDELSVVVQYVGFVPVTYSMFADRAVDSATGISFASSVIPLNDTEASLGFDYVFANGDDSAVTVRVGVFDSSGKSLSVSQPVKVPVRRDEKTVVRGQFLTQEPSGGIFVDPDYEGDFNLPLH